MVFAIILLTGALALLLLSTRQGPQPQRFFIWLIGATLLAWCVIQTAQLQDYGLFRAIADAGAARGGFAYSALAQALARNSGGVAQFAPQLLDLFLIVAAALALVALIAFTPGDKIERALRPVLFGLIGCLIGGVAAFALVAIGLGGPMRPRTYIGYVPADAVYDGDTFQIGEVSLRLWGADAPELAQTCQGVGFCGYRAREHLAQLIGGGLVQCDQRESVRSRRMMESFGRPLVRCQVRGARPVPDLAEAMIRDGFALEYRGDSAFGYTEAGAAAREAKRGLMAGCLLRPDIWRNDSDARRAFETGALAADPSVLAGNCAAPTPEAPPPA